MEKPSPMPFFSLTALPNSINLSWAQHSFSSFFSFQESHVLRSRFPAPSVPDSSIIPISSFLSSSLRLSDKVVTRLMNGPTTGEVIPVSVAQTPVAPAIDRSIGVRWSGSVAGFDAQQLKHLQLGPPKGISTPAAAAAPCTPEMKPDQTRYERAHGMVRHCNIGTPLNIHHKINQ